MTPESFRRRLRALGLTLAAFAARTGQHRLTVAGWGSGHDGRGPFPGWVEPLLTAWERYPDLLAAFHKAHPTP